MMSIVHGDSKTILFFLVAQYILKDTTFSSYFTKPRVCRTQKPYLLFRDNKGK